MSPITNGGSVRERVLGAFTLGAPGTYVAETPDRLIIGNRPGALHFAIAIGVPLACLVLLWLLRNEAWWLGAGALVLFGVPSVFVSMNSQRLEITPERLSMRGRALGFTMERDWALPADSAVRLGTRVESEQGDTPVHWSYHQAQILTELGWIGIAESKRRDQVLEFSQRLARAANVVLLA